MLLKLSRKIMVFADTVVRTYSFMTYAEALQYFGGNHHVTMIMLQGQEALEWETIIDGRPAIVVWYKVQIRTD